MSESECLNHQINQITDPLKYLRCLCFFSSWDEMASKDLPAVMNHIVNITKQREMYYVGHSQGTMIAFAEFSHNQELTKKVKKFFALGPVSTVGYMKSPLKYLAPFVPELKVSYKLLIKICFPIAIKTELSILVRICRNLNFGEPAS